MPVFILSLLARVPVRDWLYIVAILSLLAYGVYLRSSYIAMGRQEAISAITQANEAARGDAAKGVADVQKCFDAGFSWNRVSGVCDRSAAR